MEEPENHQPLSFGDALFLYLEREGMPLHVGAVCVFEGAIPLGLCLRFVASKLPRIPRYRQRVVAPPFNIGPPVWEFDPAFNVRNHVREVKLERGTDAALKALAGRIFSATMDRARPLWDMTLVSGLQGNRTGLVIRVHHSLADGISGVGLMRVLLDETSATGLLPRLRRFHAPPPRDAATLLVEGAIESCFSAVQRVLTAHSELLAVAQRAFATVTEPAPPAATAPPDGSNHHGVPALDQLRRFFPDLASPAERLPFNVVCRGPQKFTWAEIPLADIKAARQACEATVNDVALAIVTAAVARYAALHKMSLSGRTLRIVVPVSVRARADVGDLGNRITFVPVDIPLDVGNLRRLTCAVRERTTMLKEAHVAELVGFAGTLLGTIPAPVQALLAPIAGQLPLSVCNLICTNVPGPRMPLYLMGRRMIACYPRVPIGGEMGMNVALITYDGAAYFGFTGDAHAVPDLEQLPRFLVESFAELQKAAGIRAASKKPRKPKPAVVVAPEPLAFPAKPEAREEEKPLAVAVGA
jgi:diacylglycerol O-acyltransferase